MTEPNKIEALTKNVRDYINIRAELVKLNATDKASTIIAALAFGFIASLLALLLLIIFSLGLGFYLSFLTGSAYSGFLIVTGFYLIIGVILLCYRKKLLINPIRNIIIRQILSDEK